MLQMLMVYKWEDLINLLLKTVLWIYCSSVGLRTRALFRACNLEQVKTKGPFLNALYKANNFLPMCMSIKLYICMIIIFHYAWSTLFDHWPVYQSELLLFCKNMSLTVKFKLKSEKHTISMGLPFVMDTFCFPSMRTLHCKYSNFTVI